MIKKMNEFSLSQQVNQADEDSDNLMEFNLEESCHGDPRRIMLISIHGFYNNQPK